MNKVAILNTNQHQKLHSAVKVFKRLCVTRRITDEEVMEDLEIAQMVINQTMRRLKTDWNNPVVDPTPPEEPADGKPDTESSEV